MATFGDLKAKVADDMLVGAAVTDTQVAEAVLAAIRDHEQERFWFNEGRTVTFVTVDGTQNYTILDASGSEIIQADYFLIDATGNFITFSYPEMFDYYASALGAPEGEPRIWTNYGSGYKFYPTPDAVYTVRAVGHIKFAELEDDADTNVWTNEGFELIRARAKWDLAVNVTHDDAMAQRIAQTEARALNRLREETSKRTTRGYMRTVPF